MATHAISSFKVKSVYNTFFPDLDVNTVDASSSRLVGQETNYAGDKIYSYRTLYQLSGELPEQLADKNANISKIVISYKVSKSSMTTSANIDCLFRLRAAGEVAAIGVATVSAIYKACGNGAALTSTLRVSPGATYESTVTITDSSAIASVMDHGIAFDFASNLNAAATIASAYATVVGVEITYENYYSPPEVSFSSAEIKQSITESCLVSWDYSQMSDASQSRVDLDIAGSDGVYESVLSDHALTAHQYTLSSDDYPVPYAIENNANIRLRAYSDRGVVSEYVTMPLILIFPSAQKMNPSGGETKLSADTIRLSWSIAAIDGEGNSYNVANNPTKFDLQYSINSGETWYDIAINYTAGKDGDTYYYDIPANTLPSGVITWRVRPYANGYVVNNYSQESFVVRVQASTSFVTCNGKPHPTVSWNSSSQIAYQVRFADYDSGAVYGSETSHTIPYFYADGNYPVQVRTQATDGAWSDWTEREYVTIQNVAPLDSITLTMQRTRHAVVASWVSVGTFDAYILYRNGIPVFVGTETTYTDVAAYAICSYYVRGIYASDYVQSDTVTVEARPEVDCIYDIQNAGWIPLKYSLQPRSRGYSETANVIYKYYVGRSAPVAYVDGTDERQLNVSYVFKSRADAERLRAAKGHIVIYKDTSGGRIIGILDSLSWDVTKLFAVSLRIVQVDYKEDVPYEA